VFRQITQAIDKLGTLSKDNQDRIVAILRRYSLGDISLDEAYYELLEEELIPMPQRCSMSAKIPSTAEDEVRLKERISRL